MNKSDLERLSENVFRKAWVIIQRPLTKDDDKQPYFWHSHVFFTENKFIKHKMRLERLLFEYKVIEIQVPEIYYIENRLK